MLDTVLKRLNQATLMISGLAIVAMVLAGGLDVISGLVLSQPIPGAYEATETLMVFTVFLALGYLHQDRAYIAVDILYLRMGPRGQRAVDLLTLVLMTGYFAVIAWRGWAVALRSWSYGEYSVGLIAFPLYPARFALALGATLAVVCCLADLAAGGRFRKQGSAAAEIAPE